jgi:hypothetical protein
VTTDERIELEFLERQLKTKELHSEIINAIDRFCLNNKNVLAPEQIIIALADSIRGIQINSIQRQLERKYQS